MLINRKTLYNLKSYCIAISFFYINIKTASTNPDNQLGSGIPLPLSKLIIGLEIGLVLGKASFRTLDKPLFIDALIFIICYKPAVVAYAFALSKSTANLNKTYFYALRFFFFIKTRYDPSPLTNPASQLGS
jgi:hypothetical protein